MLLTMAFGIFGPWHSGLRDLELPMEISLEPYGRYAVREWGPEDDGPGLVDGRSQALLILAERGVDPGGMEVVDDHLFQRHYEDGRVGPAPAVISPEIYDLTEGARCICGAISFLTGIALAVGPHLSARFPTEYVSESREDEDVLIALEADRPRLPFKGSTGIEVFDVGTVDADLVGRLALRRAVRVYPEALHGIGPAACFKDLWRALELAFQAEGKELIRLVSEFPPAQRLGFDRDELERLRALRGQISHASSRLGPREVSRSEAEAVESVGRLWSLVDWVLLSKKDASRSLEEEELRPLVAFVERGGATSQVGAPRDWDTDFGTLNPRFNGGRPRRR